MILARVVWLTALWVVLWRDASVANLLSGAAVAVVVPALFPERRAPLRRHRVRPVAFVRSAAWFLLKLVQANLVLAKEIVTPRDRLRRGIVAVPVETPSDVVVTIAANAITLTPGSLTVEIGEGQQHTLYVHVLHLHDVEEARREIVEFERFASQAVAATEADDHHSKGASP